MPWNKDGTRKKSVLYKKRKFEARSPFIMKSAFKQLPRTDMAQAYSYGAFRQPGIGSLHTLGLKNQAKKIRASF